MQKKGKQRIASEYAADMQVWAILMAEDNGKEISELKRNLIMAIKEELTDLERESIMLYYGQRMNMVDIAAMKGTAPSSVSRNISRAEAKLKKVLKYGGKRLLKEALWNDAPKRSHSKKTH